jgi:hypothetical protein
VICLILIATLGVEMNSISHSIDSFRLAAQCSSLGVLGDSVVKMNRSIPSKK